MTNETSSASKSSLPRAARLPFYRNPGQGVSLAALLAILVTLTALAQDAAPPASEPADAAQRETPSFLGRESSQGVYVRDSTIAVEKFALAQRMERLKEWDKAADALQELVEKYTDRVVPSKKHENDVIYQYTSVTRAVHEQLARWPAEGLEAYRARYESVATELAESDPTDLTTLNRVYTRYFATLTGKTAAMALIDRYFEAGEFPAAAWLGDRLLKLHPALDADRPAVLYRTALAYHLSGDAAAKALLDELTKTHGKAKGTVRGQEVVLAESLATELNVAPPTARTGGNDSWPMIGGAPSRSRVTSAVGRMGAKIFEVPYSPAVRAPFAGTNATRREWASNDTVARERGQLLGVMPAVDRGELFFQDNASVYAVNLDSGLPLPGWATTYPDRNGVYTAPRAQPLPRNLQSAVVVTDNEVVAITGQLDREAMARGMAQGVDRETRLVCLDRVTGAEKWATSTRSLPDQAAALRGLELGASPLVAGEQVFVIARGGKPNQFEDCYVLCFGLKDGKYRWSCYLASGNATAEQMDGGMGLANEAIPHLAYASGRVYALTNLGALGAIDAYNGATVWLNLYPRPRPEFVDFRARMERSEMLATPKPWEQNPVIVDGGHVFVLPADSNQLLVYDAGNGVEVKRIPLTDIGGARSLLGAIGEKVLVTSNSEIFCVRWPTYDPNAGPFDNIFWKKQLLRDDESDIIRGRGFVTTHSVFIPTRWTINRISLENGKLEDTYPKDRSWNAGEGPGNIVVTEDHVVIAGLDGVSVYTDLEIARAKLDAAVAAAPNDPNPRLEYAEVMFVAGQLDEASQKLDEAIGLLGGASAMRPGAERDRVFNVALTFARKLTPSLPDESDSATPPTDVQLKLAPELFDRAAAAAGSPAQQVNYRVTRALFESATSNVADELRLYQEILLEPQWRAIQLTSRDDGNIAPAAAVSERAIARILAAPGAPEAFKVFQQAAAEELRTASEGKDPEALLAVAQRFPNTHAAPVAMLGAAGEFEAAGKHRSATQVLNQASRKYRDRADQEALVEAQVRNYLKLPNGLAVAIGRLAAGTKLSGEHRFEKPAALPDGSIIESGTTFAAALDLLRQKSASLAAAKLPSLGIPVFDPQQRRPAFLPEDERVILDDIDLLLVPSREFARHDRFVTFTAGKGIAISAVGATAPLSTTSSLGEPPSGCAWVGDGEKTLLVWGNSSIALFTPAGNDAQWRVQLASMDDLEVVSTTEGVVVDGTVEVDAGTEVQVQENQRIRFGRGVRRRGMQVLPNGRAAPAPANAGNVETIVHVCPLGDRVLLSTSSGRVLAIAYATGDIAWQTRLSLGAIHQMIAADDFAVARLIDDFGVQLVVVDTFTGQVTHRRIFSPDGNGVPVNMTLAPDGTLIYTLANRLCGKNLYDPGRELDFEYPSGGEAGPTYIGANMPDQLVVADDRILAVSDNGVLVRVHSLESGKEIAKALSTGGKNWNVRVRVVGASLYVVTESTVTGYNLNYPERSWPSQSGANPPNILDILIGDKYLLVLDQVGVRGGQPAGLGGNAGERNVAADNIGSPRFKLWAYGRYPAKTEDLFESGRLDYAVQVTHPVGISQWQAVEGGLYYRSADRKLHFLRGAEGKE